MSAQGGYQELLERSASVPYKKVLVVEGPTDVQMLNLMLDKPEFKRENPMSRWIIGAAGGKTQVLKFLERQPEWHGLVDRDAWTQEEIHEAIRRHPNLHLLPRFCLENFLIDPEEIYPALKSLRILPPSCTKQALTNKIQAAFPHALAHGALWRVIQPLYDGLMARGFNGVLLDFEREFDREAIYMHIDEWHRYLSPGPLMADYERMLKEGRALSEEQALRTWIHGKSFWRFVVLPALENPDRRISPERMLRLILKSMALPKDLMGALQFMRQSEPV